MDKKSLRFRLTDILLLILTVLPLLFGSLLNVFTKPLSEEAISISGARIFFTLKGLPFQDLPITESQVNSWLLIIAVFWFCIYLTHGIASVPVTKRQLIAEWIVEKCDSLTVTNMGDFFAGFSPFIAAIMGLSAFSSLLSLLGMYSPTADLNVVGGWALLVFFLITFYKMRCGLLHYIKSFGDPVPFIAPLNVISEIATPVSMTFRHYGNILSGSIISVLVGAGLSGLSNILFGWLPGVFGTVPFLQIGIPAVLSVYFDLFSGCLQAFIFATLTMLYISGGFPLEDYLKRKNKKALKA